MKNTIYSIGYHKKRRYFVKWAKKACFYTIFGRKKGLILCQLQSIIQIHFNSRQEVSKRNGTGTTPVYRLFA